MVRDRRTLTVGFATRDVTPAIGVPLSGYGGAERRAFPFFKPSIGVRDRIRAKAFVLVSGARKLVFVSLDVVAITADCQRGIVAGAMSLGFSADAICVSATHTHSGPGALSRELVWKVVTMGAFQDAVYQHIVSGAVEAVRAALANAQPATLSAVTFAAVGLQRNRRHPDGFYDPTANVLLAQSVATGRCLGAMVNLAIHGTALQAGNLEFSADVPGGIERALEARLDGPVMFVNGAVGDVSPIKSGPDGITLIGERFAEQAMTALNGARRIDAEWSVQTRLVELARPRLNLKNAGVLKRLDLNVGLGMALPRRVPLTLVRLGDMMLLTWPGEPTTSLGFALKGVATDAGAAQVWVLGVTNGYFGYFVTPDEYRSGGYEAGKSLYGPDAGVHLIDAFRSMLAEG